MIDPFHLQEMLQNGHSAKGNLRMIDIADACVSNIEHEIHAEASCEITSSTNIVPCEGGNMRTQSDLLSMIFCV